MSLNLSLDLHKRRVGYIKIQKHFLWQFVMHYQVSCLVTVMLTLQSYICKHAGRRSASNFTMNESQKSKNEF
jgi:hypothetical protein